MYNIINYDYIIITFTIYKIFLCITLYPPFTMKINYLSYILLYYINYAPLKYYCKKI